MFKRIRRAKAVLTRPQVSVDTTTIKTYSILHEGPETFCRMRVVDKGGETIQLLGEAIPRVYLTELINVLTEIRDGKEIVA